MNPEKLVLDYYHESRTKRNRRKEILIAASAIFAEKGWEQLNMSDIAREMSIERRTLYSYYSSKWGILTDCFFFSLYNITASSQSAIQKVISSSKRLSAEQRLIRVMEAYADSFFSLNPGNITQLNYDGFIKHLDKDDEHLKRFMYLRSQVAIHNNPFEEVLRQGLKAGEFRGNELSVETQAMIVEQAFRSYVIRLAERSSYTDHYRKEHIYPFIRILVNGLLS